MPSNSPMSLGGELDMCSDFLDAHREYALDLLTNIETMRQWHRPDSCLETRRTCTLCGISSEDGLLGAAQRALASYDDAAKRLQRARKSLSGKRAYGRGPSNNDVPDRETLFRSDVANSVFFCVVTEGEGLRMQHEMWQARLHGEVATSKSPKSLAQGTQGGYGGPSDVNENRSELVPLSSHTGPRLVTPESPLRCTTASASLSSGAASNSSMFVVFRQCLSADCPCDANRSESRSALNATPKDVFKTQSTSAFPPSPTDSKNTRTFKITGDTNLKRTGTLRQPKRPASALAESASVTQETNSSPECDTSMMDSRVLRLRAQILRSDDACRALMAWCHATTAELMLDPRERCDSKPKALVKEETATPRKGETDEPVKPLCGTNQGDAREGGGDRATAREPRLDNLEQDVLKKRWLMARQRRGKGRDRKRHPASI